MEDSNWSYLVPSVISHLVLPSYMEDYKTEVITYQSLY